MDRIINQVSNAFASVSGYRAVADVVVLVNDAMWGLHHALAHLLQLAGVAPEGLLGRPCGRMQPALAPAATKPARPRAGRTWRPAVGRWSSPRPGTERRS